MIVCPRVYPIRIIQHPECPTVRIYFAGITSVLSRVNSHLKTAFRRLYRQRNIVLHGGSTRSVASRASVRIAGPLVGAALDRIAYGHITNELTPLQLATRAQLAIQIVKDPSAPVLYDLLGT
jgi:hypothetical protein